VSALAVNAGRRVARLVLAVLVIAASAIGACLLVVGIAYLYLRLFG